MTGQPPPNPRPDRDRDLGFDELLAIFVALAAIGSILFWGLTRRDAGFNPADLGLLPEQETVTDRESLILDNSPRPRLTPTPSPRVRVSPSTVVEPEQPRTAPVPRSPGGVVVAPVPVPRPEAETTAPSTPIVVAPPPTADAAEFPDVPPDYWAYPFITDLSQRGVITGLEDGTFQPDQPVNRAQYAALIQGILPPEQRQQPIAFSDVNAGYWATSAIDAAVQAGFLRGFPDGTFLPEQPVSHVQVLASLSNGLQLSQPTTTATEALNVFTDANEIPEWAVPIVATATQAGLVVNHPNPEQLQPNQPATRAEVAAAIYQALEATGQVEPIQSRYIVQP